MFVLFEEDGTFKVGSLFSQADASVQIEMPSGKRVKVKRTAILVQFETPGRDEFIGKAQSVADGLEVNFLWEVAPPEEFEVSAFAREVFGASPEPVQEAGLLFALWNAPMYFYRKGRGRFRAAPQEALKSALAGAEKKRLAQQAQKAMHDALIEGRLPAEIAADAVGLLVRPDKQSVAYKALESASFELQMTPARLLLSRGGLVSVYSLLHARFMAQCFDRGTGFDLHDADLGAAISMAVSAAENHDLPAAPESAYSIDDVTTTEIDDAFSIQPLEGGGSRVGIHIAVPGLGIAPDDALGRTASERASTVYFPGEKITMLPEPVIAAYSLDEGTVRPVLSLYVDFGPQGERLASVSRVERIRIEKNLRLGSWEEALEGPADEINEDQLPWPGLKTLLLLALGLREGREKVRGRPEIQHRMDFNFYIDWNEGNPQASRVGDGKPRIVQRRRGSPVDTLVAEFMILANTCWGDTLALARLPGIYRVQQMGRVRMQTQPGPHQGLGVSNYAWSTSPLRRYSDLINQWQLLAALGLRKPVFRGNEAELFSAVSQFDALYNQYGEFQDTLERYWSLRWIADQYGLPPGESWSAVAARVQIRERAVALREGAFRLQRAPVILRCADAPALTPGMEVELELLSADALDLQVQARFVCVTSSVPIEQEEPVPLAELYAVLGDPIGHSRSPWIHARFAEQTSQSMRYEALQVRREELASKLAALIEAGYGGVNLTIPLKEEAFALACAQDWEISERAQRARAVNTLRFDSNGWVQADNTDGIGLVRDCERHLHPGELQSMRVLLIGAGGAAQGVIGALRDAGVAHIRLANRTLDRAQAVAAHWAELDASSMEWLSAVPLETLAHDVPSAPGAEPHEAVDDIIINATSATLAGKGIAISPHRLGRARLVVDLMYGPSDSPFMASARSAGAHTVIDGLGMLVEQAAEAFHLWRGVRPQTASVLEELRLQFRP